MSEENADIKARREELMRELRKLEGFVKRAQLELELLKEECKHPNQYKTSHMGESCLHCPDCGNCP